MDIKYTAEATSSGGGRDGAVKSADGTIDEQVRMPRALGGDGEGTNPEQLFAAAYSSCFQGALGLVAKSGGVSLPEDATVTADVGIGPDDTSFAIAVTLIGSMPGLDQVQADDLMQQAHQVCPYSKATRGNVEVRLESKV